jgi:two-component system nitrogen regulation sensor histidine kinase NtrY
MAFNRYTIRISLRLGMIFLAMLGLALVIGREARLFTVLSILLVLVLLIVELFYRIARTNRIVESLLESVRYGDMNRKIQDRAAGLGFESLADAAQEIIRAIASAKIEKETQYQYLHALLEHIHTAVLTLDESGEPELVNPLALNILELYNIRKPSWASIEKASPGFAGCVKELGASGRKMIRLPSTPVGKQLLVLVNTVRIRDRRIRIITFQDIEPEIGQKELESWQTISRIMAHEIMNSLTPLSSLTETGIMLLETEGRTRTLAEVSQQTLDQLHTALRTISDRNEALCRFIGNYRQLSRLPLPEKKELGVAALLEEIQSLHKVQCGEQGVAFSIHPIPDYLVLPADEAQIKQVLINLVKNGLEALEGVSDPQLTIRVKRIMDQASIEVSDNGKGIPEEVREKIFVPFFSTKPEGSGIGLSLSRQIIANHGGRISVESRPGRGSTFRVSLPIEADIPT